MPKTTLVLKSSVTRHQTVEPVDQAERQAQSAYHQAVESAASPAKETAPAEETEPSGKQLKREAHALQFGFLSACLGKPVTVFLMNGIKLAGRLRQYDQYCILLEGPDGVNSLTFKHAISTIAPVSRQA